MPLAFTQHPSARRLLQTPCLISPGTSSEAMMGLWGTAGLLAGLSAFAGALLFWVR